MLKTLLVVEDQPKDLQVAAEAAEAAGIPGVEGRMSTPAARAYLDRGLQGEVPLPDAILLDLDLGYDSGYELLRHWHSSPDLSKIPLIIWSILSEQENMCKLFKVHRFVPKWEGLSAIREALQELQRLQS